jgi:flavin-dependent dehydrogenase
MPWGRALGREHLDTQLLELAARDGVVVRQPWSALECKREGDYFMCRARAQRTREIGWLKSRIILAAHGSWDAGDLPTQLSRSGPAPDDLLGFKAHFCAGSLRAGLMPLLVFPGGYGGMVHTDSGRISLSCCLRRDTLERLRAGLVESAGEAVLEHLRSTCLGARQALAGATREGVWMSSGPIRVGMRLRTPRGIFALGNTAGEAHPVIAEGITMALQSAWLLSERLIAWRRSGGRPEALDTVAANYRTAYLRSFGQRILTSIALAQWAMRPAVFVGTLPAVRFFPALLTWGAGWTGKAKRLSIYDLRVSTHRRFWSRIEAQRSRTRDPHFKFGDA